MGFKRKGKWTLMDPDLKYFRITFCDNEVYLSMEQY